MAQIIGRELRLKKRPSGMVSRDDFELMEVAVTRIVEGESLQKNIYISVGSLQVKHYLKSLSMTSSTLVTWANSEPMAAMETACT